ncbi:hypothetical protein EYC59_00280 [Candidatus Saccharibacteria bacterium]|nr:MAG: hypothetical protein EYC59_00280 [Candidatus Saccharibacteria bacterium]
MAPSQPKTSKFRAGWELAKSAWRVLKLDKELSLLPLLSAALGVLTLVVIGGLYFAVGGIQTQGSITDSSASFGMSGGDVPGWVNLLFGMVVYFSMTVIANFFGGAVIYGAVERFRGGDPTVKSSLAGVRRKFRPLLLFSLMMATIGFALQALEQRLPLAGKIAVWLVGAAWNIANFFAIPIIVMSDEDVHPFDATRGSVGMIKKVWGESVVASAGVGIVFLLGFIVYLVTIGLVGAVSGALISVLHVSGWFMLPVAILAVLGFAVFMLLFATLDSIVRAALYHYATTGKAPEQFNQELLRSTITPKKARKIFN